MRNIWVSYLPGSNAAPNALPAKKPASFFRVALWSIALYLTLYPLFDRYLTGLTIGGSAGDILAVSLSPPVSCVLGLLLVAVALPRRSVRWLRTRPSYQGALLFFKYQLLPFFSAVGILVLVFGLTAHYVSIFLDGTGAFCQENGAHDAANDGFETTGNLHKKELPFDAADDQNCRSIGVFVQTGKSYNVKVTRAGDKWTFFDEPSYMGGQPLSRLPWYKELFMAAIFPLRRTLDRPWGTIMLRVGGRGNDEYFIDRDPPDQSKEDNIRSDPKDNDIHQSEELEENIKARRDGELFIYVNKPVIPVPWFANWIGATGAAKVTISYSSK